MKKHQYLAIIIILITLTSCTKDKKDIIFNFTATYDGAPLVMLQEYDYPDGPKITFTRVSYFISDLQLGDDTEMITLSEVEMINFVNSNTDEANAILGISKTYNDVEVGDISHLRFNVGLTSEQNGIVPEEQDPDSPLAESSEYWVNWGSYIFVKLEGKIDLDNDGDAETTFALHLGSDEMMRALNYQFQNSLTDEIVNVRLRLDVKDMFEQESVYDIISTHRIHTLDQLSEARELMGNMVHSFYVIE